MLEDEPFDILAAAIIAIAGLYDEEAQRPIEPLNDDEAAPLWPLVANP